MKQITKYACALDRIYGTETEYGLYWNGLKTDIFKAIDKDFARKILDFDRFSSKLLCDYGIASKNYTFLKNGGLIKKDNLMSSDDCTPEYATPECRSALDAVCWEKAGEIIIHDLFDLSGKNGTLFMMVKHGRGLAGLDIGISGSEVSCGHHENYSYNLELKEAFKKESFESLVFMSFLASRILFSGAGWLNLRDFSYQLSQRADFIEQKINISTTANRPLICSRDESLGAFSPPRLHLVVGEHLMSEVALFLTLGTTGLVLRMLESKFDLTDAPILSDPIMALRKFNSDPTLKSRYPIKGELKEEISAIDIQSYFCEKAKKFINSNPSTEEEHSVVNYWSSVLGRLKEDPYLTYGELDWVTKLAFMESYLKKNDIRPKSIGNFSGVPKQILDYCMGLDLLYHFITPDGIYNKLKESGFVKRLLKESKILEAVTNSPQNTRAKTRGEIVGLLMTGKIRGQISDWNESEFHECQGKQPIKHIRILMEDPFDFYCQAWQDVKKFLNI